MFRRRSFAPFVNEYTRILVLGTMPGEASLAAGEYYAFKHNAFWKIVADLLNQGQFFESYEQKLDTLAAAQIGLWDNLFQCKRVGSLDSNITEARPNDFASLFKKYPNIRRLVFNGQKSFQFFQKFQAPLLADFDCFTAPSTSPANASFSYAQKLGAWKKALEL